MVIKLGIIGTGGMANCQVERFKNIKDCTLIACCDIDKKKAEVFANKHGIKSVYEDYNEMLSKEKIDAVSVVTSDAFHAPVSIAAFKAGKHVLCEKPMSTNVKDAYKMLLAANKAGTINMINFSYHCAPAAIKAAELIKKLGEIRHVEASYLQSWVIRIKPENLSNCWRLSKKLGGSGVLYDIGCHILDLTTSIVGDITGIRCVLKTHKIPGLKNNRIGNIILDANNAAFIFADFKNGATGIIHTTYLAFGQTNSLKIRVYATKGAIEVDLDKSWTELKFSSGSVNNSGWFPQEEWKTLKCGNIIDNYTRFIRSIKTGKQDSPTFYDGYKIQKYLDACFKSAEKNSNLIKI